MQIYKSLKKIQNLFKNYYLCIGSLSSHPRQRRWDGLSLPLCKRRGIRPHYFRLQLRKILKQIK